jgi:diguanylate cyclase (GGDEF)-like protein
MGCVMIVRPDAAPPVAGVAWMPLPVQLPDSDAAFYVLLAALAILCILGVGLLAFLLSRPRTRPAQPRRALQAASGSRGSLEPAHKHLADAQITGEYTRDETRWIRRAAEIRATIDLDDVLSRTLALAGDVPGVDAAIVAIDGGEGEQLVAASGLSAEEVGALETPALPRIGGATAVGVSYRYPVSPEQAESSLLREGVVLPLALETSSVGSIAVFSRSTGGRLTEATTSAIAEVAAFAASAIRNAQSFRKAHELAMLDTSTGLYNDRFFYETLDREVARAVRYHRPLSLLLCGGVDTTVSEPLAQSGLDHVAAEVAAAIRHVVRAPDFACRVGDNGFGIILPESVISDAERLFQRLEHAVALRQSSEGSLQISGSVAELVPSETPKTFYHRAREARDSAVRAGLGRLEVAREHALPPPQAQAGTE